MLKIARLARTTSFPDQWEGRLTDGRPIFIHHKYGDISVYVGPVGGTADDVLKTEPIFEGEIDLAQICALAGLELPDEVVAIAKPRWPA